MTNYEFEKLINGHGLLVHWGEKVSYKLTQKQKQQLRKYCEQGFAKYTKGIKRDMVFSAYSLWCDINKKPQIKYYSRGKYMFAEIDMILTDKYLSVPALVAIADVLRPYHSTPVNFVPSDGRSFFRVGSSAGQNGCINGLLVQAYRIFKYSVDDVLTQWSEIANNPINWVPKREMTI